MYPEQQQNLIKTNSKTRTIMPIKAKLKKSNRQTNIDKYRANAIGYWFN